VTSLTRRDTTPTDAADAAAEAFLFGYPLVLMDRLRGSCPANAFVHERAPASDDDASAAGTLACTAWLDLQAEPVVLSVSDCHGRYYVLSLIDMWTDIFASIGPRTTGTSAGAYAIGGPRWTGGTLPAGVLPIAAPTNEMRIFGLTQLGPTGTRRTEALPPDAYRLEPLSRWRHGSAGPRPAAPAQAGPPTPTAPPATELEGLDATTFFTELAALLERNPPRRADGPFVDRMRRCGVLPGAAEARGAGEARIRALREQGMRRGLARIHAVVDTLQDERPGAWRMRHAAGPHGTDYLRRAVAARAGPFATSAADLFAAVVSEDADGHPLSAAHRYRLRFPADDLPPVRGCWSLASGRSAIGDADGLTVALDGSLTIYIQPEPPRAREQRSNWLPTPSEGFRLVLRMCWPAADVLDGRWSPPTVTRVA
jgi:hypothetical protein